MEKARRQLDKLVATDKLVKKDEDGASGLLPGVCRIQVNPRGRFVTRVTADEGAWTRHGRSRTV